MFAAEELTPRSKGPLIGIAAVVAVALIAAVFFLTRETPPTVVEIPIPVVAPRPVVKPPEPDPVAVKAALTGIEGAPEPEPAAVVAAPEPVVKPPEPEPVVVKPPEPVVVKPPPTEPVAPRPPRKDMLVERFTKLEAALARRSDKEIELKRAKKFLERLKAGTLTAEQREQAELAAKLLEDSLKE